jgi:hypothetical protein
MEVVAAADPGHVVLGGEKIIVEPRQDFRQPKFDGEKALTSFPTDKDVEFHEFLTLKRKYILSASHTHL